MPTTTAIDFKAETARLFDVFDRQDVPKLEKMFADDVQGVDEISRRWMRGHGGIDFYFETN